MDAAEIKRAVDRRVYFIRREDTGLVKIGCSIYPEARRKQLQIDHKAHMVLLAEAFAPDRFSDERRMHAKFSRDRVTGEWFRPSGKLLAMIEKIARTGRLPIRRSRS